MEQMRGSSKVIAEIARMSKRISVDEMATVADAANAAGGSLVSVNAAEDDDDWCGNGRIIVKWPPKRDEFYRLMNILVEKRINYEVLINGIPVPDEIMINVAKQLRRY